VNSEDFDVAIVGASLAGSATAALLARQGVRVALIERRSDASAYKAMCTHFIQASATPVLERLGLIEQIEAAGGVRNGLESWTPFGWVRPEPGPTFAHPRYGYDIRREKLDPMLRGLAADTPGVDLVLGQTVTTLARSGGRPVGVRTTDTHHGELAISARVVVGADGRDSGVARLAGVRARVKPHGRFGYFAYYRDLPLVSGDRTLFWFLDPDVAYAFPQDDGLTLLATFQTVDRLPWFKRELEANFEATFRGLPNAPDLGGATRISKIMGKLELPNTYRPAAAEGVAFVGDAAMAADPLWGVGCGFALQSAEWLADAVGPALAARRSDAEVDAGLARYRRAHRRRLLGHYLLMSDYATGRRVNAVERLLFSAAARDSAVADGFYAFGTRSIGPTDREFGRVVARAAWTRLARRGGADVQALSGAYAEGTPLPAGVQRSRIDVGGVGGPVCSAGPGDAAEAVVFVHGNPGSSRDWDDLLSRAGAFARAIALDLPGFGRADKPADFDYTVGGYATYLGQALDLLGVERAHLVLHDFGGPWGLEWALRHPERLASATLINTGALLGYHWHYLARVWRTPILGELFQASATRDGLRLALRHGNPRGLPRAFVDRMYDDSDAGTNRAVRRLYRATGDPAGDGRRLADALREVDPPALVLWGGQDPYLPVALAERQREMFPRAEVAILPDSGHWPFADDPLGTARHVEPFLRARTAARERDAVPA
jgi:2-polyprenyl-6-methoxyphenol hydroxylase-like FAD-dependent oxidoreductase/pimeloyl-ACP methyl ester carboxylesterase